MNAQVAHQFARFAAIGMAGAAAYAGLYLAALAFAPPVAANLVALLLSSVAGTAANRRLTFRVSGRRGLLRDHAGGLAAFALTLAFSTSVPALFSWLAPNAGRSLELAALLGTGVAAAPARFALLRRVMS